MKFLKKTTQYQIQKHLRFVIGMASLGLYPLAGQALGANPDPKTAKEDPDGKTLWYDCKNMKIEGKGWSDTEACYDRLPLKSKSVAPKMVWDLSKDSTGMCIRFTTDAKSINVRWSPTLKNGDVPYALPHMAATAVSGVDLYAKSKNEKWQFKGNGRPTASVSKAYFNTTPGQEHLLYLPLYNGVSLLEIGIPKDRTISQPDAAALKKAIVFYGTSVTQGACASRPGMSSTAITLRRRPPRHALPRHRHPHRHLLPPSRMAPHQRPSPRQKIPPRHPHPTRHRQTPLHRRLHRLPQSQIHRHL